MATVEELAGAVAEEAGGELESAVGTIRHCVRQLDDAQMWYRASGSMNSIANLILHLSGNVRQWITAGVGGLEDNRNRPLEFSERGPLSQEDLLLRLDRAVAEARAALAAASANGLLRMVRIQGFETTGLGAIFHSVSHFRGHTQEIVHVTRSLLGEKYEFAFVPTTPEQGAPE